MPHSSFKRAQLVCSQLCLLLLLVVVLLVVVLLVVLLPRLLCFLLLVCRRLPRLLRLLLGVFVRVADENVVEDRAVVHRPKLEADATDALVLGVSLGRIVGVI